MLLDQERINSVFQKVERQLAKIASKPQPDHVHQFRTSTRRIEALLQELVPKQDRNQRKLLKELSQLRRRAGRIRDVDVQVQALLSLKAPQEATLKAEVLRSLAEMRAKREAKLLKALDKQTVRELRKRLKRAAGLAWRVGLQHVQRVRFAARAWCCAPSKRGMDRMRLHLHV